MSETMNEKRTYEDGIRTACAMVDEMYGRSNRHKFMQGDCVLAKLNMLPTKKLRPNPVPIDPALTAAEQTIVELRNDLAEAAEQIADWGGYASEYFQEKHDLAGTVAKYRAKGTKEGG